MKDKRVPLVDDGMAGIGSALVSHHYIGVAGQDVHDLALALISPLGSNDDQIAHPCHRFAFRPSKKRALTAQDQSRKRLILWTAIPVCQAAFAPPRKVTNNALVPVSPSIIPHVRARQRTR